MNLNKLYDLTEKEKIKVYKCNIDNCNGIYLNYEKTNAIGLNYDKLGYAEEKCTLAEELGHYYQDATYSLYSDINTISKKEYRAKKWAYNVLIPIEKLKEAINKGLYNYYELAEYFEVSCDFMYKCLNYYKVGGIL